MQCPYCSGDSSVTETRVTADGMRRRRVCTACKRRFTTYEKLGAPLLKVAKRDGSVEPFDGEKLFHALQRVAAHRDISDEDLRRIARDIEATLVDSSRKSVTWNDIVSLVLDRLRNVDPITAHRFAANYTDETGVLRFENDDRPAGDPRQLGLPLTEED
ncbi:MAG TPA: ATP cone domain-containing protein [Kofleriaceae bacterium]|nr:ATP cone domain-containing protein [Kofleriaceae bacterium]